MNDSLFDTKFTAESKSDITDNIESGNSNPVENDVSENSPIISSINLPSLNDSTHASALINYRVLISANESGCLIGQNGQVIDSIRADTNTKAGISKLQSGSQERILTVSGTLDDCSKALSYFAQALCNSGNKSQENYNYFPLKQLSIKPCIEGETTILRLLIPNSQMGTLIGSKGLRIQQIQSQYNISMIASKTFLPGSNERLVELQGSVNNLYDALRVISRCLIEDFSSVVGTKYYVPRGYNQNSHDHHGRETGGHYNRNKKTTTIGFPNEVVGALIGKNGARIQGVRKISGATIGISDEEEGKQERIFTISGTPTAVEKAKGLLYHNLEREEERRREQTQSQN